MLLFWTEVLIRKKGYSPPTQKDRQSLIRRCDALRCVSLSGIQLVYPRLLRQLLEVLLADLVRLKKLHIQLG